MPTALNNVGIAGLGVLSAAGKNAGATINHFRTGHRNPAPRAPFATPIVAASFPVISELPQLPGRYNNSRTLRLAMQAINEAMIEANLQQIGKGVRVGVCLGTTVASQLNNVPFYQAYRETKQPPLDPVYDYLHANLANAVGDLLGTVGPRMTIVNACSSGTDAINIAATWIRAGLCDLAIAGGADELNRVAMAGFWSLGVMSTEPCRPFDRDRTGLNLGEGAGVVILESEVSAIIRGRTNTMWLAGAGSACDAHHLTAPHPDGRGLEVAIRTALTQANISPDRIAFINAHGTATLDNDRAEAKVFARIFGPDVKFVSTKGYTGHTLGAAGGLEAVFAVIGLREGWIPASAGFANKPEDFAVAPVCERTTIAGEYALSTSLAFGGNNAAVVVRRQA